MTLQQYIDELEISISNQSTDRNPHMEDSDRLVASKAKTRQRSQVWPFDSAGSGRSSNRVRRKTPTKIVGFD